MFNYYESTRIVLFSIRNTLVLLRHLPNSDQKRVKIKYIVFYASNFNQFYTRKNN